MSMKCYVLRLQIHKSLKNVLTANAQGTSWYAMIVTNRIFKKR